MSRQPRIKYLDYSEITEFIASTMSCDVIIENKHTIKLLFFFKMNKLDVKKGKQTCTCLYEQIN
jgi:hypothetical protein